LARMPLGCPNGSTALGLRRIAPRSIVNFPTSPSATSSLGRRRRIGTRFCSAHRGRHWGDGSVFMRLPCAH
jgi:hypothetical protein